MHLENGAEGQATGTALTAANSGGGSGDAFQLVSKTSPGTIVFSNADAALGTQSYLFTNGGTSTTIITRWSWTGVNQLAVRFCLKFNSLPGTGVRLLDVRNSSASVGRLVTNASNQILVQTNNGGTTNKTFAAITTGVWYRFEMVVVVGTTTSNGTIKVDYYNSPTSTTPVEAGVSSTTANTGTTPIVSVDFGSGASAAWTGSMYIDTMGAADQATYLGPPVNNVNPTANAGLDQTVEPFSTVTLDGSASNDPDGTIASYAWSLSSNTSSKTPTLSSSTVAKPTYTAPGDWHAGSTQTWQLTVTDNLGGTGTDSVVITVNPATRGLITNAAAGTVQALSRQTT